MKSPEVCGCFCSCFIRGVCLQFDKHGSNLEQTKLKLLEAANLVDKVTSDVDVSLLYLKPTSHQARVCARVTFLCSSTVLQGPQHPCGINRPGGVDQRGPDQRLRQPPQHFGSFSVVERQAAPRFAQRQCPAHHVSGLFLCLL